MIDIYAVRGTFSDPHRVAAEAAATVMDVEHVPDIGPLRQNTAAFVHELDATHIADVEGDSHHVRIQVLTNAGALDRDNNSLSCRDSPTSSSLQREMRSFANAPGFC